MSWQPIFSAPADSTMVLVWLRGGHVYVAHRGGIRGDWLTVPGGWGIKNATHWQPLPGPPDDQKREVGE